ncbi:MarR family transcriptional regulator [Roseisolibacter sp. H3M3-2]|uniref:MarR family winged helix-turn-helix transcriptional regulator n=1 Tax=Roseisolibacter sp. H3M3-2 TaxID=3031323 RepID=UPI0023DA4EE9|nr:MarR family transcriptional regulator [Roseisolibacter sp. H3M3-2]MDF1505475.1 MarR family transcriptional regulator [Roseisolibacter sp. H3M3-2]
MQKTLQDEIRQTRPFSSLEQEALLSLERTAAVLGHAVEREFKAFGVTPTQVNVLRILRGSRPNGLCRHEIGDRLVTPVPDVTRLLDRMEEAGWILRERSDEDRRLVRTTITDDGLAMLERLDEPMREMDRRLIGHLSESELRALIDLLTRARHRD